MSGRSTWSRMFSLGSLPGSPEEARAFLQRRIALFAAVVAGIGWTILIVGASLNAAGAFGGFEAVTLPLRLAHVSANLVVTAVWLTTRWGRRSLRVLNVLDGAGTKAIFLAIAAMILGSGGRHAIVVEMLLVLNVVTTVRAALVPSEPARTMALGLVGALVVTASTAYLLLTTSAKAEVPTSLALVTVGIWSIAMAVVSTVVTRVIYGLHRRIEEAAQLGQYQLEEKIGEGGMGSVFRARHAILRRPTAVKLLPPDRAGEKTIARFEREVQVTAGLTHPNTIAIYDYGRTPDGIFYYAMEYLDGLDLQRIVEVDGPQPPARVVHVLRQVASALAEAHAAGLVHRDVKPANVILCERGGIPDFVKVVDFGLVKEVSGDPGLSGQHVLTGTPLYMAPEGISRPDRVSAASDLYALGAVAYFLLTGAPPFEAKSLMEVLAMHLSHPPARPGDRLGRAVPADLEALVLALLAKEPAQRPASAIALVHALDALSVPRWSDDDARAWWSAHAAPIAAVRASERTLAAASTIQVDVWARLAG